MYPLVPPPPDTLKSGLRLRFLQACTDKGDNVFFTDCCGTGDRVHTHRVVQAQVTTWDPALAQDLFPTTYCSLCHIAGGHADQVLAQLRSASAVERV